MRIFEIYKQCNGKGLLSVVISSEVTTAGLFETKETRECPYCNGTGYIDYYDLETEWL
jgi:DnaJ-class molecular chaperone